MGKVSLRMARFMEGKSEKGGLEKNENRLRLNSRVNNNKESPRKPTTTSQQQKYFKSSSTPVNE